MLTVDEIKQLLQEMIDEYSIQLEERHEFRTKKEKFIIH